MSNKAKQTTLNFKSTKQVDSGSDGSDEEKPPPKKTVFKKPTPKLQPSKKRKLAGDVSNLNDIKIHPNYNEDLTKILTELSTNEKNIGDMHRSLAYRKAVQSLKQHPKKITSGAEASALPGIGKRISEKIDEILKTGKLTKLEKANMSERTQAINLISRVFGIGPAAAKKFVDEDEVRTLDDLLQLRAKLNNQQLLGLKYFEDFEQRIPREEIKQLETIVKEAAAELDKQILVETCGSYRRGLPTSGDIDILLTHPKYSLAKKGHDPMNIMERLIKILRKRGFLLDDLSLGSMKYMGVCHVPEDIPLASNPITNSNNNNNNNNNINTTTTTTTTTAQYDSEDEESTQEMIQPDLDDSIEKPPATTSTAGDPENDPNFFLDDTQEMDPLSDISFDNEREEDEKAAASFEMDDKKSADDKSPSSSTKSSPNKTGTKRERTEDDTQEDITLGTSFSDDSDDDVKIADSGLAKHTSDDEDKKHSSDDSDDEKKEKKSDDMKHTSDSSDDEKKEKKRYGRRIDIKLVPIESFYFGVMHSTGSDEFNRQLRAIALNKGFTLSEYGLYPVGDTGTKGDPLPVDSEEGIFDYLGVDYVAPEKRSI